MTWWQWVVLYYCGYQFILFCRFMLYGRQRLEQGGEGWLDHEEAEGEDPVEGVSDVVGEVEQGEEPQTPTVSVRQRVAKGTGKARKAKGSGRSTGGKLTPPIYWVFQKVWETRETWLATHGQ